MIVGMNILILTSFSHKSAPVVADLLHTLSRSYFLTKIKFMKKIIIGLCLLSATTMMYARDMKTRNTPERNVPMSVKERFHRDYPDANAVHWKYNDGRWDASFRKMDGNIEMMACYNAKGHHIDSRVPIARAAVPDKVMNRLNEKYPGRYAHR